jgi:hypothetical protein
MTDNDPFGRDFNREGGQPWFGPKRFGLGYGPRTWQGYLLVALCLLILAIVAAITGGHSPLMVLGVIPFVIVAVVARVQGRRWR